MNNTITDHLYQELTRFANSDNFWTDFELIFGTQFDRTIAEGIRNKWTSGDFGDLPPLHIVSSQVLGSANGGYNVDTNTIYLSDSLLNSNPTQIITVLLEEIGHFIDAEVNLVDTLGDEGEYFASIIQKQTLSDQDLWRIKNEDDTAQIIFNNQTLNIEQNVNDNPLLNGPVNTPDATGLTDNNDDFTDKSSFVPANTSPGSTLNPQPVGFTNTFRNIGTSPLNVSLLPTAPATASQLPNGTIVTITANNGGFVSANYSYNNGVFTFINGSGVVAGNPISGTNPIRIDGVAGGSPVNYGVEIDLPDGTPLSTDRNIERGFPVPIVAFIDGNGNGVPDDAFRNTTINRVYTGFLQTVKLSRILKGNGPDVQGSDGILSSDPKKPAPGNIIEYVITYENISEPFGGAGSITLSADRVAVTEDGLINNWAIDNDSNGIIDTSHVIGSAQGAGTIQFFSGNPATNLLGGEQSGSTVITDITKYINTPIGRVSSGTSRTFIFRRQVNSTNGGTFIENTATVTYEDPNNPSVPINSTSNTVNVSVAEVAGITVAFNDAVDTNGGLISANDLLIFTFTITNIGNDPTGFRIPSFATINGPATVSGTLPNGGTPNNLQYSTDNGTSWQNISFEVVVPNIPVNGQVLVRVPVTVAPVAQAGDIITATLGNTFGNAQNVVRIPDGGDVYTVDNPDGSPNEVSGSPVNEFREASATGSVTIIDFVVTNTNDSGTGSLRQAILNANAIAGHNTITFAGVFTDGTPDIITLTSGQLNITDSVTIEGTGANLLTISGNNATRVFNIDDSTGTALDVRLEGLNIQNGNMSGDGGGIYNNENLTLINSTLSGNSATNGGAIFNNFSGTATLTNATLSGNSATVRGGAVFNYSTVTLTNATLSGNTAGNGGAISNNGGTATLTNATLSGNTAGNGGAIGHNSGTVILTNATLSGNTASSSGGAIYNAALSILTLTNATLSGNNATNYGGAISNESGTATLTNNLIAGNNATNLAKEIFNNGTITSNYNLYGDSGKTNAEAFYNFTPSGTNITATSDGSTPTALSNIIGTLANNGGSTLTHALLPGSPAIGTGNTTLTTDQRGITRPQGTNPDIGAFEYVPPTVSIIATDNTATEVIGNSGIFQLTRVIPTGGTDTSLPVQLTLSGSASASDYNFSASGGTVNVSGNTVTVTFNSGSNTVDLTVTPVDDIQAEPNETVILTLNSSVNYNQGTNTTGTVTISQNDFVVTNTNDSGEGSLRQAILNANAIAGANTITFNITGGGVHTIDLDSALPDITEQVTIDGTSQPGYSNTPLIEIDGTGVNGNGFTLNSANNTIKGLIIKNFKGSFLNIGVRANSLGNSIENNIIFGNSFAGIALLGSSNIVKGNFVGTNATSASGIGNVVHGIYLTSSNNIIGGANSSERNVVSGNGYSGVAISSNGQPATNTQNNIVKGNYIGTDTTGTQPLGNGGGVVFSNGGGVRITGANNTIGGTGIGEGNIIANNAGNGVYVTDAFNANPTLNNAGNNISGNSIFNNTGLGIDLATVQGGSENGITPNDLLDPDTGVNNLQNYPLLIQYSTGLVKGRLNSTPNNNFRIEFFSNTTIDPSGNGEGQTYLGFENITTGNDGNAYFTFTPPMGSFNITATATDSNGNTSEFSRGAIAPVVTIVANSNLTDTDVTVNVDPTLTVTNEDIIIIRDGGEDTFNIQSVGTAFQSDIIIDGNGYTSGDPVNLNGSITINDFTLDEVQNINVASNVAIITIDLLNDNGDVNWTTGKAINFTSGSSLTTTKGNINLTAKGTATGSYQGIIVNDSLITSSTGAIELNSTGGGNGGDQYGVYLLNGGKIISTNTATIKITGQGSLSGLNGGNDGIRMVGANSLISSVSGDIELTGKAGTGSSFNEGVRIANPQVTTETGTITIQGTTNNNLSGSSNIGIHIYSQSKITATDTGKISLIGLAINGINDNDGIRIEGTNTLVSAKDGSINIDGTGGGSGNANLGVRITGEGQIKSTGNATINITGQGSTTGVSTNHGVQVIGTNSSITSIDGDITIEGTGGGSGGNNRGVSIESKGVISSTGTGANAATINITGKGTTHPNATGNDNLGIVIDGDGSQIISNKGAIVLNATGGGKGTDNYGFLIANKGKIIGTNSASITIITQGSAIGSSASDGIRLRNSGSTISSEEGAISLTGTGGGGTGANRGVVINDNGLITSVNGKITVNGTGGGTGSDNYGVFLQNGAKITSTGTGDSVNTITVIGKGSTSATGNNNDGIRIENASIESIDGDIIANGTGGGSGTAELGIRIFSGGKIQSTGKATISVSGFGSNTGNGTSYGVQVTGANSSITSVDGNITIEGTGGGSGGNNGGVSIESGGVISSSGKANISVTGNGSKSGTGNGNDGVRIENVNSQITTKNGSISITGTAGTGSQQNRGVLLNNGLITSETGNISVEGTGGHTGISNYGVWLTSGGSITSTGTGGDASQINVIGKGAITGTNTDNDGVRIDGTNSKISSIAGAIDITGTAGNGTNGNRGVVVFNNGVVTSETGNITVNGTGSGTGNENYGVYVISNGTNGGVISSTGTGANAATINITGQGSLNSTTIGNDGVRVEGTNSKISSVNGAIFIAGTAGTGSQQNRGVLLINNGLITSETGNISVNGTGGNTGISNYGVWLTSGGSITSTGTGGDASQINITGNGAITGTNTDNDGVRIDGTNSKISSVAGLINIKGTAGNGTNGNRGVVVFNNGVVTSGTGNIAVNGTGSGTGSGNYGVYVISNTTSGGVISSTGTGANAATITVTGQGSLNSTGGANDGVRIEGTNSKISSIAGVISITGTGGKGAQSRGIWIASNGLITSETGNITVKGTGTDAGFRSYGVALVTGGGITSTGTGSNAATITITGEGTSTSNVENIGVYIDGANTKISSVNGAISVTGTGGNGTNDNYGVYLSGTGQISSTGTEANAATITITGQGSTSATGNNNDGIRLNNSTVQSNNGNIVLTGTGGGTGTTQLGVRIFGGAKIKSTGKATINIKGFGGENAVSMNHGVQVTGGSSAITSIDGDITIEGTGRGTGSNNRGVSIEGGGVISSTGEATITVIGKGSINPLSTGGNRGVRVEGTNSKITSVNGAIFIRGTAGETGNLETTAFNHGVQVIFSGEISSTGIGADAATITIEGDGGSISNKASLNAGVEIEQGGKITSIDGAIKVTGSGGSGTSFNMGILLLLNGEISSTGIGQYASTITVVGNGSTTASGDSNYGVVVENSSRIKSKDGDINITGTGGSGTQLNSGVDVNNLSQIYASDTANIMIMGTGGEGTSSDGIHLDNSTIQSNSGNITLTGTANNSSIGINVINSGLIVSNTGNITLETNTISLDGGANSISSSGELLIIQETDGTSIALGSASGTLNLTSSEIASFKDGFSKITIGNNKSGVIDIQNATFTDNLTLISGSNIVANGLTVTSANATILSNGTISEGTTGSDADISATNVILSGTVKPGAVANTFGILNINGNLSFENDVITDILSLEIDGDTTAGVDFDQLSVTGTIDITGVTLNFNNSNIINSNVSTSEIILIDNDDTDAIIGSFSNYEDGDLVTINDLTYIVDYQGGDGNDFSLNLAESEITIDGDNNLVITDVLLTDTDDRWTISFDGTDIIVTDTEGKFITTNIVGATGNNTSEITIPLTSFAGNLPSGIITNTLGGNNIVSIDDFTSDFGGDLNIKGDGYSNDNTIIIDTNPNSNDFSINLVKNIEVKSAITTNDTGDNGDVNWIVGESIDFADSSSLTTTKGNINLSSKEINLLTGSSIVSNTGNITLETDTISLDGGNDSISSSGELLITQQIDGNSIGLGSGTGTLNLTSTEIASFKDGFSQITIGNDKTGAVKINNATFQDNLVINGSSIEVIALNGGNNNITLNAPTGDITHDNNPSTTDITADELNLNANAIIGTIQINANTLSAIAQTGDVRVTDTNGGLTVNNAQATGGGSIALKAVGGDLNINTVSAQFDIGLIAEDGKITDTNGIGVNNITSGTSTAFAKSGIDLDVSTTISGYETTGVGDILLRRSSGGIDVSGGGIKTNDGDISISITSGNLRVVSGIIAGGTNTIKVNISGNIQDFNADDNNFTATSAKLDTGNGIGTIANAIEIQVTNLAARASTSGDIAIKNTGALTIDTVEGLSGVSANNGQVNLSSTEGIVVNTNINAIGNITLKADTMSLDGGNDSISSSGELLIIQETDNTSMGLGSGSGTLNLTSSEIFSFKNGFSKITIGNNKSGVIDIQNATFQDNLTLISGSNIIANGLTVTGANTTIISNGTISEGMGTTDADITATNIILSGTVKPGEVANTFGILNINGNLSFENDAIADILSLEIDGDTSAGTNFDQLSVIGTVNITGVTLNFNNSSTTSNNPRANEIILIDNDGTADAIIGSFTNYADDSVVTINDLTYVLDYQGGDGNDVSLKLMESQITVDGLGNLVITDISGENTDDQWTISSDGTYIIVTDTNGKLINTDIVGSIDNNTSSVKIPLNSFTNGIIVNSLGGDDIITVDFSDQNPIPDGEITFNGGDDNDSLELTGGIFTNTTYTYVNENDGNISFDGKIINYNDLEPLTANIDSADIVLDYSTSTETITITEVSPTQTNVDSTQGETTTFNNPSNSLTINGGTTGTNTFNLDSIGSEFSADLNINGSAYTIGDVVNINGDVTSNDFSIDLVQNINVGSGKSINTDNGDVNWTAGQTINFATDSSLTATKGNINLMAKGEATGNYSGIVINGGTIISDEGSIDIDGTGEEDGIGGEGSQITANGNVTLLGEGTNDDGVDLEASSVTSNNGTITIDGTGGDNGIGIEASVITAYGDIVLSGEGTTDDGVNLEDSPVTSNNGSITIEGTGENNGVFIDGGSIESYSGAISITGETKNSSGFGINLSEGTSIISDSGQINLLGNTINLDNNSQIDTTNDVYINSDKDAKSGVTSLGVTVNITADTLFLKDSIEFSYNTSENRFDTINVTGEVDLTNSSLDMDFTNYTPVPGDIYTLINNDGIDAVTDTFTGLLEGDIVATIGSVNIQITYQGDGANPTFENIGKGNDVQLYMASAVPLSLQGTGLADTIVGGFGENTINSGGGNDSIVGGIFSDSLIGGSGNDTLLGNNGDDVIDAGSGNDSLLGGNGNDIILAGSGNDTIVGGIGNDTLTGGSGNDFFRFNSANEGIDRITDFNVINDSIELNSTAFSLPVGTLANSQFSIGSSATSVDHRLIYNRNTGALFFDNDGNGVNSALQIAQLNSRLSLTHEDFVVI